MTGRLPFAIIGAGPSGLAMACLLSRMGQRAIVYESRPDPRRHDIHDSRSISLTLSSRGLDILDRLGIADDVKARANSIGSRMIHAPSGQEVLQRYSAREQDVLYGISRDAFLKVMLEHINREPGVQIQFNTRFLEFDRISGAVSLQETMGNRRFTVWPRTVIGADGVYSAVRQQIHKRQMVDFRHEYFPWTYKEVVISSAQARVLGLRQDVLHIWPRPQALLVAFANADGSFGCDLFLERDSNASHMALTDVRRMERFLARQFEDLSPAATEMARHLANQKESGIVRVRTSSWHYEDKAVVIGDAAHAIYQFYGHGTSADLEDCAVLCECLANCSGNLEGAFVEFERRRMADTWELSELSRRHFYTLKDRSASLTYRAGLVTDTIFAQALPGRWHLAYALVAHSSLAYGEIIRLMRRQKALWFFSGLCLVTGLVLMYFGAEAMLFRLRQWTRRVKMIQRLLVRPA